MSPTSGNQSSSVSSAIPEAALQPQTGPGSRLRTCAVGVSWREHVKLCLGTLRGLSLFFSGGGEAKGTHVIHEL